jgi:hypothetical protein
LGTLGMSPSRAVGEPDQPGIFSCGKVWMFIEVSYPDTSRWREAMR